MAFLNIRKVLRKEIKFNHILFYCLAVTVVLSSLFFVYPTFSREISAFNAQEKKGQTQQILSFLALEYRVLVDLIEIAKVNFPSPPIDFSSQEALLKEFREYILLGDAWKASTLQTQIFSEIISSITVESNKGEAVGKVSAGSAGLQATLKIMQNNQQIAELQSSGDGLFSYRLPAGKYVLKTNASGYYENSRDFEIKSKEKTDLQISLSKVVSTPAKPKSAAPTDTGGMYSVQTVYTDRGTYTVHLLQVDLNQYDMKIDTAADGDCLNDCPVQSLGSYVSQNGGVAGIHGTYFCPTAYPSCAGETNGFYFKLYNTRLDKRINWDNGLGDYLPFLSIDRGGGVHYYGSWSSARNSEMKAGISCRPHLVEGGEIVLMDGDLDSDKERYSKISHGFIGLKGQVIYAGIVMSATVPDSAAVVKALGAENGFNIDGGGTSALYYNSSYKVGPGRDMPNAIIFTRK